LGGLLRYYHREAAWWSVGRANTLTIPGRA
jgi:hypothetical protein